MQSKEYLKIKARKIAKQTWAGPGKFGVFIIICIIIIATFESLGLSNREKNLELRNVPLVAVQLNLKNIEEGANSQSDSSLTQNQTNQIKEANSNFQSQMILSAAVEQYLYENNSADSAFDEDFKSPLIMNNPIKVNSKIQKGINDNSTSFYTENNENLEYIDFIPSSNDEDELDLAFFDI